MEKFTVVWSAELMDVTFWNFPRALQDEGGEGAQASREGDSGGPLTSS